MDIQGEKIKCLSNFQAPELVVGKIYTAGITRKNVHCVWQVLVEGKWYTHDRFELVSKEQSQAIPPSHVALGDNLVFLGSESIQQDKKHSHYFKKCGYDYVDVYRILKMFDVTDPCISHAAKKLLVSGGRGFKDIEHDIQDVIDTLVRWQEMRKEDSDA